MKSNNMKSSFAQVLANISLKLGKISVNSNCAFIYHQPKMPLELKKLKEK